MRRWWLAPFLAVALIGCRDTGGVPSASPPEPAPSATVEAAAPEPQDGVEIVIAASVRGSVNEDLVREAFRRVRDQAERDFGLMPERTVRIYVDPDSAIGLEDALGLSQKYAIHLRAGRTRSMEAMLPLMMHEYTHTLQYQIDRLRPQWWVEGQADHQALRILAPPVAERERRLLLGRLADDVRAGRAPALTDLRGSYSWDQYIARSGSARAYGWGHAAVAFIEERAGFAGVVQVMKDSEGPNTMGRFDDAVQTVTGLDPAAFDAELKRWVAGHARA